MGRAARMKRERRAVPLDQTRPRWAGANGFDYAWTLNQGYLHATNVIARQAGGAGPMNVAAAEANVAMDEHRLDVLQRQLGTLETAYRQQTGQEPAVDKPREPCLPGSLHDDPARRRRYAAGLGALSGSHDEALRRATPILFDPLSTPEIDERAAENLRLPFPTVTCDFLSDTGLSMPVLDLVGRDDWVGLIAATIHQEEDGVLDVWPVVTTLAANRADHDQAQRALLYGRIRLGGDLPPAPEGIEVIEMGGATAWTMPIDVTEEDRVGWAWLWLRTPALAAVSALQLLEAVNVSLQEATLPRPARRRAQREGAEPALEVVIRSSGAEREASPTTTTVDWQHRWTVRGHWMHFKRGPIFNGNPRKRVMDPVHGECVRVWCPPFVKGPSDKPLVLKSRRLASDPARG